MAIAFSPTHIGIKPETPEAYRKHPAIHHGRSFPTPTKIAIYRIQDDSLVACPYQHSQLILVAVATNQPTPAIATHPDFSDSIARELFN